MTAYQLDLDDDDLQSLETWLSDGHMPSLLVDRIARQILTQTPRTSVAATTTPEDL